MTKLSKQAAELRIKQLRKEITRKIFYRAVLLKDADKILEQSFAEVSQLVKDHELESQRLHEFKDSVLAEMYARAGEFKEFAWQASFAKRHGI